MELFGKIAIVTGGGGAGSGRATAKRLAREGVAVVIADIAQDAGRQTVRGIEAEGGRADFIFTDVRHAAEVRTLVTSVEERFGGLDILINNASGCVYPETSLDDWFANLEVDLLGAMYCVRYGIEAMRRRGGGAIVNIGSVSALPHGGGFEAPGYNTAKAGMMRLTTALERLGGREGIRVNCLVPGWIGTPPVKAYWGSLTPEQRKAKDVPEVLLSVEEIADAVIKLTVDDRLAGRVFVWWNGQQPALIAREDRGYVALEQSRRHLGQSQP